jgi:hypothetical protein
MVKILESLKGPDQPTVSLMVKEVNLKPGAEARVKKLREGVVGGVEKTQGTPVTIVNKGGIIGELSKSPNLDSIKHPDSTVTFPDPPWPRGSQLIDFADKPEDAQHAHFEITYEFVQIGNPNSYSLSVKVEFRTNLDGDPVATYEEKSGQFGEGQFDQQITELKDRLIAGMVGKWGGQGMFAPPPRIPLPNLP